MSYGLTAKEIDVAWKNIRLDNRENSLLNKAEEVTITAKGLVDQEAALLEKLTALRQDEEGLKIEEEAFKNKKRGFNVDMAKLQFDYENKERTFNLHMTQRQSEIGYSDRAIKTQMRSLESRTRALDKKGKNLDLKLQRMAKKERVIKDTAQQQETLVKELDAREVKVQAKEAELLKLGSVVPGPGPIHALADSEPIEHV